MAANLDPSLSVSLTNPAEAGDAACLRVAETLNESLSFSQVILSEATHLIAKHQGSHIMRTCVRRLLSPAWRPEPGQTADLCRLRPD